MKDKGIRHDIRTIGLDVMLVERRLFGRGKVSVVSKDWPVQSGTTLSLRRLPREIRPGVKKGDRLSGEVAVSGKHEASRRLRNIQVEKTIELSAQGANSHVATRRSA